MTDQDLTALILRVSVLTCFSQNGNRFQTRYFSIYEHSDFESKKEIKNFSFIVKVNITHGKRKIIHLDGGSNIIRD